MKNYVVLDLENPNARGNSICSIAIIEVKDNNIVNKQYTLINPEDRFDAINSKITGITGDMVLEYPTLKDYWLEIKDILEDNIIIGHNVRYDLNVLSKALNRYDIEIPQFKYCCTLELSQEYLSLDSYKLEEIAKFMNFDYNAHIALDDAMAAYKLFEYLNMNYKISYDMCFSYNFDLELSDKIDERLFSNINNLFGIIQGINYDGIINDHEIKELNHWIEENYKYKQYTLFNKIINRLTSILEDNNITEYEKMELIKLVDCVRQSKIYNEATLGIQVLQGIIKGISCDKKIVIEEISNLRKWLMSNEYLKGVYPYDKVLLIVNEVLADGILTEKEKVALAGLFDDLLNPVKNNHSSLELDGKSFCLSGDFKNGSKSEISSQLQSYGAIEKSSVSSKLDYLFVGGLGSDAWKYGNVGGKIAKAQELQEKGHKVQIISEDDLYSMFIQKV